MSIDNVMSVLFGSGTGKSSSAKYLSDKEVDEYAEIASERYDVPKALIRAVIDMENPKYDPKAKNPNSSATGLMQLIDSTASEVGVKDSMDPLDNVMGGTKYLRKMLNKYNGDQKKAVAAYFKGPGTVDTHLKSGTDVTDMQGDLGGTTAKHYLSKVAKGLQKYGGTGMEDLLPVTEELQSEDSPGESRISRSPTMERLFGQASGDDSDRIDEIGRWLTEQEPVDLSPPVEEPQAEGMFAGGRSGGMGATRSFEEEPAGEMFAGGKSSGIGATRSFDLDPGEKIKQDISGMVGEAVLGNVPQMEMPKARDEKKGTFGQFFSDIGAAFERGDYNTTLSLLGYEAKHGNVDKEKVLDLKKQFEELNKKDPVKAGNWLRDAVMDVAGMVPAMQRGGFAGAAKGAIGAAVGSAVPGIGTVAGGAAMGLAGSMDFWARQGSGQVYLDMLEEGVSDKTANIASEFAGVPYAAIEYSQLDKLIPGSGKTLKTLVGQSAVKVAARFAAKKGMDIVSEAGEEGVQEFLLETTKEVAKYADGLLTSKDIPESTKKVLGKSGKAFVQSLLPMAVLMGPRASVDALNTVKQFKAENAKTEDAAEGKTEVTPPSFTEENVAELDELRRRIQEQPVEGETEAEPQRMGSMPELTKRGEEVRNRAYGVKAVKGDPQRFNELLDKMAVKDNGELTELLSGDMQGFAERSAALNDGEFVELEEMLLAGMRRTDEVKDEVGPIGAEKKTVTTDVWTGAKSDRVHAKRMADEIGLDFVGIKPGERTAGKVTTPAKFIFEDESGKRKSFNFKVKAADIKKSFGVKDAGAIGQTEETQVEDDGIDEVIEESASEEMQRKAIDLLSELNDAGIELKAVDGGSTWKKSGKRLGPAILHINDMKTAGEDQYPGTYHIRLNDDLTVEKLREYITQKRKAFGVDETETKATDDAKQDEGGETGPGVVPKGDQKAADKKAADPTTEQKGIADEKGKETETVLKPERKLIDKVKELVSGETKLDARSLRAAADEAYGGTVGEGKYQTVDSYDVMETAINEHLSDNADILTGSAEDVVKKLDALDSKMATQSVRNEEKTEFQQFSTPHSEAFVAVNVSGIREGMDVLEPSAGTGNIATLMKIKGANVVTNELAERRQGLLKEIGFTPLTHNAEQLDNLLPADQTFDVVVMNPPFSATAGRVAKHDTNVGGRHVYQALRRVKPGGRLVAIVGRGMRFPSAEDSLGKALMPWWASIMDKYTVRANVGIDGKHYQKFGTGFDNQIIVIDNTGPTPGKTFGEKIQNVITVKGYVSPVEAIEVMRTLSEEDVSGRIEKSATERGAGKTAKDVPGGRDKDTRTGSDDKGTTGRRGDLDDTGKSGNKPGGQDKSDADGNKSAKRSGRKPSDGDDSGRSKGDTGKGRTDKGVGGADDTAGDGPGVTDEDVFKAFKKKRQQKEDTKEDAPPVTDNIDDLLGDLADSFMSVPIDVGQENAAAVIEEVTAPKLTEEQEEKAFKVVQAFINAGVKDFPSIAKQVKARAEKHLSIAGFKEAIEDAYDAFHEIKKNVPVRGTLFMDALKEAPKPKQKGVLEPNAEDQRDADELNSDEKEDGVFEKYEIKKLDVKAKKHPARVVESISLGAVSPPDITYKVSIPQHKIDAGVISGEQLEFITYAGQTHEQLNVDGSRREALNADGCVDGETKILNPVTGEYKTIRSLYEIGKEHVVLSLTKDGLSARKACAPFIKGVAALYEVALDNGKKILVTDDHRFLTSNGWMRIVDGLSEGHFLACVEDLRGSNLEFYRLAHDEDEPNLLKKPEDCLNDYCFCSRQCDEQLLSEVDIDQVAVPSKGDVLVHSLVSLRRDETVISREYTRLHRHSGHRSKNSFFQEASPFHVLSERQDGEGCVQLLGAKHQSALQVHVETKRLLPRDGLILTHQNERENCGGECSIVSKDAIRDMSINRPLRQSQYTSDRQGTRKQFVFVGNQKLVSSCSVNSRWNRIVSIRFKKVDIFYDMHVPGPQNYVAEGIVNHNTGMGKGREIAGVILDNYNKGRKRAIWVTISNDLIPDAQRDLYDNETKKYALEKDQDRDYNGLGVPLKFMAQQKVPVNGKINAKEGILFTTYSLLRDNWKKGGPRVEQIRAWLGEDFDGVIVFDEAHQMKNAYMETMYGEGYGGEGSKMVQGSDQGQAGLALKKAFPKARIVNASATSATTPANIGYLTRMGLWGAGTPFRSFKEFLVEVGKGGIGAMEMLARDMKAMGSYFARVISYRGVKYENLEHRLNADEVRMYDTMAEFWSKILKEFELAAEKSGRTKKDLRTELQQFYGMQQRFFLQLMTSIQLPTMLKDADKQLADGRSVVISMYNTNEQSTKAAVTKAIQNGQDIEDIDISPKDIMVNLVEKHFPIYEYQKVKKEDGTEVNEIVKDKNGNPVINRENFEQREKLVNSLRELRLPGNPMDLIISHFGANNVAEVTGREERIEPGHGLVKRKVEGVSSKDVNKEEIRAFQSGRKRVALISGAASTGVSLHSGLNEKNQQRRVFYALQLSWSADVQMQSFGRVHRSFQRVPPVIKLVTTDIASQKRLVNTTQKRLASLGAMAAGHRESFGGGLFSTEDITDKYGNAALDELYEELQNDSYETLVLMNVFDKEGKVKESAKKDVNNFLNRIMVLPFAEQNRVFERFYEKRSKLYETALSQGLIDTGVKKIKLENLRVETAPEVLYTHTGGATTELVTVKGERKNERLDFPEDAVAFYTNTRSGAVYALRQNADKDYFFVNPKNNRYSAQVGEKHTSYFGAQDLSGILEGFEKVEDSRTEWDRQKNEVPEYDTETKHIITGMVFPIYDKIVTKNRTSVVRADTKTGSHLGLLVEAKDLNMIRQRLGIGTPLGKMKADEIFDMIQSGGLIELDNGWKLRSTRMRGEYRIELMPVGYPNAEELELFGLFHEDINWDRKWFVPTDKEVGVEVLKKLLQVHKAVRDASSGNAAAIPEFVSVANNAAPVTPTPKQLTGARAVKGTPGGKAVAYATVSAKTGNHIVFSPGGKDKDTGFLNRWERGYTDWKEMAFPIQKLEDIHNEDLGITKEFARKIDIAIDKVRGVGGITRQFIDDNLKPVFDSIKENKSETYAEIVKYLVAKRSVDLYEDKEGYVDGAYSKAMAEQMVEYVETGAHPYAAVIQQKADEIWAYGKKLLQIKLDHGIIDDELRAAITEEHYVPFYRDMEEKYYGPAVSRREKYTATSKGIMKIKGSVTGKAIIDPVQSFQKQTLETMLNAYRADVANLAIDMAERSPEVGKLFEKIDPKWVRVGTIEHRGEIDAVLRPQMENFSKQLGLNVEYFAKLRSRIAGKFRKVIGLQRGNDLKLLIGATESTFAHELGHGFHFKVQWYDALVKKYDKEFKAVGDTRYAGVTVSPAYVAYTRSNNEVAAEFIAQYITDRDGLRNLAPNAIVEFEAKIAGDPVLKQLIAMKPTNIKGLKSLEKPNFVLDRSVPKDEDVISVLRDGEIVSYRVPMEVAHAIKNLHPAMFPAWFRILMIPNRMLRAGAVGLNIDFVIPNAFRDQQEAAFNAKTIPLVDLLFGLKSYITKDEIYKQYNRLGGSMDSPESGVRADMANINAMKYGSEVGKYLDPYYWQEHGIARGLMSASWYTVKSPLRGISLMAEVSEMSSRLGTFRRAQKGLPSWMKWYGGKQMNADNAMHMARQATLDFHRFGRYGRTLNEVVPFINAALEGIDRMGRTIKDDPKRALLKALIYTWSPLIGLWLWNKDKEKYKTIPLQEKLNNWIVMKEGGQDYWKMPKGHISKFIGNPIQIMLERSSGYIQKGNFDIVWQMAQDISPLNTGSIPPVVRLLLEPVANYDFYWGETIEKPAVKNIAIPGLRHDPYTSELLKRVGKALNISPVMMQHEIEVLGAGAAKNALWVADVAMGKIDASKLAAERMPIARRFYGKAEEWRTDIDESIRQINGELARISDVRARQLVQRQKYSFQEIREVVKTNAQERIRLIQKRNELLRAKAATKEMMDSSGE